MVINYISAHDNHTLWDKLLLSNASNTVEQRIAMNKLGAGIVMISQGTPFMQAGEEMLRTKNGDENSYKSSDEINNINWDLLTLDSNEYQTMLYYKGLMAMRKAYPILGRDGSVSITFESFGSDGMVVHYKATNGDEALVLINPTPQTFPYTLDGQWKLVADGDRAGADVLAEESGNVQVAGRTLQVYIK